MIMKDGRPGSGISTEVNLSTTPPQMECRYINNPLMNNYAKDRTGTYKHTNTHNKMIMREKSLAKK